MSACINIFFVFFAAKIFRVINGMFVREIVLLKI